MKNSNYTLRSSRTLQEAFGPYTSTKISEPKQNPGHGWLWWSAMVAVCVATVYFVVTGVPA